MNVFCNSCFGKVLVRPHFQTMERNDGYFAMFIHHYRDWGVSFMCDVFKSDKR